MMDTDLADAADLQAYDAHRLDELEANWRANGPFAEQPELSALGAALAKVTPPGADLVPIGRKVFAAIRDARKDEIAAGALRKRAREELAAITKAVDALRRVVADPGALGLPRIAALMGHRGLAVHGIDNATEWFLGAAAVAVDLSAARDALASQGNAATPLRRLAERLAPLFEAISGRRATVTQNPLDGAVFGPFVDLVDAASSVAGIRAQAAQVGNAAKLAAETINLKRN